VITWFSALTLGLILAKLAGQFWLDALNRKEVLAHAASVPETFRDVIDPPTYTKSVQYTLAKSRLHQVELAYGSLLLIGLLFSGVLPSSFNEITGKFSTSNWGLAAWLFIVGLVLAMLSLPIDWYAQFRLEQRFGFNTTTVSLWLIDKVKGLLLTVIIGYPLLVLVLRIMQGTGRFWWVLAWGALFVFQLLMLVLAPVLILPLFNKFMPLPEGSLQERLLALAQRTGFRAQSIQVMDGSKRSRHSNAFFTGFGSFRKIVLFDTLIEQLSEVELEAVLAHEIGHYKKKHIVKFVAVSVAGSLVAFYLLSLLVKAPWFYTAFGFAPGNLAAALLLFGLLSGTVSFWLSPLVNFLSRRYEYQADAFAAAAMKGAQPLIAALRKLNEKNLSNLTPHPLYSGFYYSHPGLLEREGALTALFLTAHPDSAGNR
jgi:STE24 endopeptidase